MFYVSQFIEKIFLENSLGKETVVISTERLRHPSQDEAARDLDQAWVQDLFFDICHQPMTISPTLTVAVAPDPDIPGTENAQEFKKHRDAVLANPKTRYIIMGKNHFVAAVKKVRFNLFREIFISFFVTEYGLCFAHHQRLQVESGDTAFNVPKLTEVALQNLSSFACNLLFDLSLVDMRKVYPIFFIVRHYCL